MFQVLATMFFSAALLTGVGVIAAMIADNLEDVRRALRIEPEQRLAPARVLVRRVVRLRGVTPRRATPLRAAA